LNTELLQTDRQTDRRLRTVSNVLMHNMLGDAKNT